MTKEELERNINPGVSFSLQYYIDKADSAEKRERELKAALAKQQSRSDIMAHEMKDIKALCEIYVTDIKKLLAVGDENNILEADNADLRDEVTRLKAKLYDLMTEEDEDA